MGGCLSELLKIVEGVEEYREWEKKERRRRVEGKERRNGERRKGKKKEKGSYRCHAFEVA